MNGLRRAVVVGVIAGVCSVGLTANAWSQPPGHPPMGGGMGMGMGMGAGKGPGAGHPGMMFSPSFLKDQLKLSDEQIDKFKKLRNDYERETIRRGADIKIAEMDLWDLFEKKDLTADQLEKKVREIEAKKTDLRVFRFKQVFAIKSILTPEQFEKFRSLGMSMFGGGGGYGRGGGMGMSGHPGMGMGYGDKHRGGYGYGYDQGSDEE
ncbi:MAG TPA: periplasmic heavy metal sensor [Nitrospiria bacterium]|nr:periplasmic heavy metal sensor [Nitrospiria bacterium]